MFEQLLIKPGSRESERKTFQSRHDVVGSGTFGICIKIHSNPRKDLKLAARAKYDLM
jgi:hypothetical protein